MTATVCEGETVVVWGDSIGKGVVWNEQRSRYGYSKTTAATVVENELNITVVNRSKFGYTAPQGLEILQHDLAEGIACDVGVIEFGGNDCNFQWAEISQTPQANHEPATVPEQYEKTLKQMVTTLIDRHIRPVLVTLPPINAERYFKFLVGDKLNAGNILGWLGDVQQIYRFQEMYSHLLQKVAHQMQIQLLDLRVRCLANPNFITKLLCNDGLHLTEEGQQFVGKQIADMVRKGEE